MKLLTPYQEKIGFNLDKMSIVIEKSKVNAVEVMPTWQGLPKNAVANFDTQEIKFHYPSFVESIDYLKRVLVTHEFLRLMGLDDENYQLSVPALNLVLDEPLIQLKQVIATIVRESTVLSYNDKKSPKSSTCYNLRSLVEDIRKAKDLTQVLSARLKQTNVSHYVNRLGIYTESLRTYCYYTKVIHAQGFAIKNNFENIQKFIGYVLSDSKETQKELSKN